MTDSGNSDFILTLTEADIVQTLQITSSHHDLSSNITKVHRSPHSRNIGDAGTNSTICLFPPHSLSNLLLAGILFYCSLYEK